MNTIEPTCSFWAVERIFFPEFLFLFFWNDLKQWVLLFFILFFISVCSLMALLRTAWALQVLACCSQLGLSYTWPRFMFCQKSTAEGIRAPLTSTIVQEPEPTSSRAVWASQRAWLSSWGLDFLCCWPSDCQMINLKTVQQPNMTGDV